MKKNNRYLITLTISLVIYFNPQKSFTQILDDSTKHCPIKSFAITVGGDVLHVVSSPFRMTKKDGLRVLFLTGVITGFIVALDEPIDKVFVTNGENEHRNERYIFPCKGLAKIGYLYDEIPNKYFVAGLASCMLVGGMVFKEKKLLETVRLMVESVSITNNIIYWGKKLFGRARPYLKTGAHNFKLFKFSKKGKFHALPSGHTSGIFSMMTVIAKQYNHWWVKIPAYTLCVSVALQRIDDQQHWASDVILGGALGYWVGSTLVNHNKKRTQAVSLMPYINPNRFGLSIKLSVN